MKIRQHILVPVLMAGLTCIAFGAQAKCPSKIKAGAFVYAVGSSTLGSPLGEQLDSALKSKGFKFRKWAKASSGLARPDFHDWVKSVKEVNAQWSPDAYVISLGTNDYQALYHRKKWIRTSDKTQWIAEYSARVDRMLNAAAGPNKERLVVWIGPVPFNTAKGRNMSLRINRILQERISAFSGNAVFVDMRSKLMDDGKPIDVYRDAKNKKRRVYRTDNVHLTIGAVRNLMTKRVVKAITECAK